MATREPPHATREQPGQPAAEQGFRPYIAPETRLREFTPLPLIVGTLLGVIFGTSSLYLVLKVGMTVSASIPVAVISITLFRILSKAGLRNATILEHIVIAVMAGVLGDVNRKIEAWASDNNPLFAGPYSDLLSLLPFAVIALLLLLVGRGSALPAGAGDDGVS